MKVNLQGDEVLEKFIEQMMLDKGVQVEEGEKSRLVEALNDRIDKEMLRALPKDRLLALDKALEDDNLPDEKLNAIVYGSGVNFEKVALEAMGKFKKEYLGEER